MIFKTSSSTSATNPISDELPPMADSSSFGLEMKEMQEDTRPLYEKIAYVYLARKKFIEEKRDSMSPRERAVTSIENNLFNFLSVFANNYPSKLLTLWQIFWYAHSGKCFEYPKCYHQTHRNIFKAIWKKVSINFDAKYTFLCSWFYASLYMTLVVFAEFFTSNISKIFLTSSSNILQSSKKSFQKWVFLSGFW